MTQRRTPGGQRPARRSGQPGRSGAGRTARSASRDPGARLDPRGAPARTRGSGRGADTSRSANRPAAARRTASGGTAKRTTAAQHRRYTGRVTVLGAVLIALALAYTYPVRVYLDQEADIARKEAAVRAQREHIGELSEQAALWDDPDYIKIKARERFYMHPVGEKPYVVIFDPDGAARDAGVDPDGADTRPTDPWYDTLWGSVQAADDTENPR